MVKKFIGIFSKEISGLHEAAYLLAIFTFLSQVLALVRDRLLAHHFGASAIIDVYYASFRIPDFIFILVTALVTAAVLVPIFSKNIVEKEQMKKMINSVFSAFILIVLVVCLLALIFMEPLLNWIYPGITEPTSKEYLVNFSRILLLSPIFLGISGLFGGMMQAYRRFFIYAISPILYNVGIVLGVLLFYPLVGFYGLIYGVVLGLILHLSIQIPFAIRNKIFPKFTLKIDWKLVKEILSLSLPRSFALASSQITTLILFSVCSTLTVGSIAIFGFANNLQSVPIAIIGISYSVAAFPTLSRLYSNGQTEAFFIQMVNAAKHIIFWSLPVTVLFIVLRAQIVRTILGSGEFDWNATRLTAAALALFALSVLAQSLIALFVRGYYSAGKTLKPVIISLSSTILTIALVFATMYWYTHDETLKFFFTSILRVENLPGTEVLVLPLVFSVGMIINAAVLWWSFERDFGEITVHIGRSFLDSFIASLVIGYFSYTGLQFFDDFFDLDTLAGIFTQGLPSGLIGIFFGVLTLLVIGNKEIREVWSVLHRKIWKAKPVVSDQEDMLV